MTARTSGSNRSLGIAEERAGGVVPDEELLLEYQISADRTIFEVLMRRYQREIYSYLRRYLNNAELADDAFQGTFLQVHLKCRQFDAERRFRPWLYAIATNQAIDVQRRANRHRMASLDRVVPGEQREANWSDQLLGDRGDLTEQLSSRENSQWVRDAVEMLSDSMKQAIHLVYYQGMKYREAADILGIPVGTVKSRLHAAVQRLGVAWNTTHPEDSVEPPPSAGD